MIEIHRSVEQRIAVASEILELYKEGMYTIASCCEQMKVKYSTFAAWAAPSVSDYSALTPDKQAKLKRQGYVPEIGEMYRAAKAAADSAYNHLLTNSAKLSLLKAVEGYTVQETTTEVALTPEGATQIKSIKKFEKHIQPNTIAIIFALKNLVPETFRDTRTINHTLQDLSDQRKKAESMTAEELKEELARIASLGESADGAEALDYAEFKIIDAIESTDKE